MLAFLWMTTNAVAGSADAFAEWGEKEVKKQNKKRQMTSAVVMKPLPSPLLNSE